MLYMDQKEVEKYYFLRRLKKLSRVPKMLHCSIDLSAYLRKGGPLQNHLSETFIKK